MRLEAEVINGWPREPVADTQTHISSCPIDLDVFELYSGWGDCTAILGSQYNLVIGVAYIRRDAATTFDW